MASLKMGDYRAKNDAAFEFVRELLVDSEITDKITALQFLIKLFYSKVPLNIEACDLSDIFRIISFDRHLLLIPREPFSANDCLILRNFQNQFAFSGELVEFSQKSYRFIPDIYLPGYLRRCLTRGSGRS